MFDINYEDPCMYFKEAGGMTLLVVNLQVKNINFRNMYFHCREMGPSSQ